MYIDTHAHLYVERFDQDRKEAVERALKAGVERILLPNIDEDSVESMLDLHRQFPATCLPMLGLHPCSVSSDWRPQVDKIMQSMDNDSIIGIGEIGIDLYWDTSLARQQEEAYRYQIELAKEMGLPIVVHSRNSLDITTRIANEAQDGRLKGVFHCFTGDLQTGKEIADAGFYMGIGGVITYKKNQELRDVIKALPLQQMILETDAPYLTPHPYRGKRNESCYIPFIADELSRIFERPVEDIGRITTDNARRLFNLD